MRTPATGTGGIRETNEPYFVLQLSWDSADTDYTYLTSTPLAQVPAKSNVINGVVLGVSGQTQKINPDTATSTIGTVTVDLSDPPVSNDFFQSSHPNTSPWGNTLVTATEETLIAPDGTFTGATLNDAAAGSAGWNWQNITNITDDSNVKCVARYFKKGSASTTTFYVALQGGISTSKTTDIDWTVDPPTVSGTDATISNVGDGWYLVKLYVTNNGSGNTEMRTRTYPASNIAVHTGTVYVWGQHGGDVSDASAYVPTTTSTDVSAPVLTHKIAEKLKGDIGLRGKIARLYVGFPGLPFTSYDKRLTYIIDSASYLDGVYTLTLSDIQRQERQRIFAPDETTLAASISETDLIIPVTTSDTSLFPLVERGSEVSNFPGQTITYIRIDDEVIAISSQPQFDTTNGWHVQAVQRGALATRAIAHDVDDGAADTRKPLIEEHIFLEGAAPKIIYAILTGVLLNGNSPESSLPDHWSLGISTSFVRLADFQALGDDYWDITNNAGRRTRIENPGAQDGKKFIESEMLVWLGAFMPVYSDGQLGIKRLAPVLSESGYVAQLDQGSIVSYGSMTHEYSSVINDIRVKWNFINLQDDFTKESVLIDAESIAAHGESDTKEYKFKTVHTGAHTDENILAYFDTLRDRYSGPPLKLKITIMPSLNLLEVGDTVRVKLDQIRDFNTGSTLDRTFEIQQITTNWHTGDLTLDLFASSRAAGQLDRTTLSSVLEDSFYTSEGTSLDSSDSPAGPLTIVAGAVTANGTITGHADMNNTAAIYYYDGDLTINAGVTVTITNNVQLRIKGALTINGTIDGSGQGPAGGAATTLFDNGLNNDSWSYDANGILTNPLDELDVDYGSDGWFGIVRSGAAFNLTTGPFNPQGQPPAYNQGTYVATVISESGAVNGIGTVTVDQRPTKGDVSALPWFDIANPNGFSLVGIPGDLRGHGGPGGLAMVTTEIDIVGSNTCYIRGNGGAGGAGGAGLAVVCRGLSFGGSGQVDLSGGNAGNPTSYTIGAAKTFFGGHGAPGSPGGWLIMIDGNYTNPDITRFKFIATMGAVGTAAGATEISQADYESAYIVPNSFLPNVVNWPYTSAVFNVDAYAANQNTDMYESAHRLQYLPEAESLQPNFGGSTVERGKFNQLLFYQNAATPTASEGYGYDVVMTPDGSRFAVLANKAAGNDNLYVCRNAKNPEREQTIALASATNVSMRISDAGDRIMVADDTADTVTIYSRSALTWALEQTLTYGSGAGSAVGFGSRHGMNADADKLLIRNRVANYRVEYWTRTGTTWTYQEVLPEPGTPTVSYGNSIELSGDGNWAFVADDGDTPSGKIHLFKLTTNSPMWEHVDSLTVPDYDLTGIAYDLGAANSGRGGVFSNYNGTGIVSTGFNLGPPSIWWIHSIERQGETLVWLGGMDINNVTGDERVIIRGISQNGLVAIGVDVSGTSNGVHVFRRYNISEPFKYDHVFDSNADAAYGNNEAVFMGAAGQFIICGNSTTDFTAANSGHIEIWEYYPEAD